MVTAEERKQAFLVDFTELLRKHGAEFSVGVRYDADLEYEGYAEVDICAVHDGDVCAKPWVCVVLPDYEDGTPEEGV